LVKTTIDIPEALYKKAKIRAVEQGQTLKEIVLASLRRELETDGNPPSNGGWANRRLLPEFARHQAAGAFRPPTGARDITDLISEDRDAR
jgi:hypothetical protein